MQAFICAIYSFRGLHSNYYNITIYNTGYLMNKAFVHLRTRGSIMANDVRREAIEDRLRRRRERDKIEEREKPDAQGLLNFACITHFPHLSHLAY